MNIFFLDWFPWICAIYHCDKHCVKMILESTQLLYSSHWFSQNNNTWIQDLHKNNLIPYKKTHINHPCSIWTRISKENYFWLANLAIFLCKEYTKRYSKTHKCEKHILWLLKNPPNLSSIGLTDPPLIMPEKYKINNNTIQSYRNYYIHEKKYFAKWKLNNEPLWFTPLKITSS